MVTRRVFVQGSLAAWAAEAQTPCRGWGANPPHGKNNPIHGPIVGKPFKPCAKKVLPRPMVSSLSGSERSKLFCDLEKGYDKLLCLAPNPAPPPAQVDPTSLLYHMWLHDYCCDKQGVHSNWFFLPWHRAFLYFHERILQCIVGDHFRLPVWDWDRCSEVPAFYPDWARSRLGVQYSGSLGNQITPGMLRAWLLGGPPSPSSPNTGSAPSTFLGAADVTPNAVSGPHSLVHTTFVPLMNFPLTAALDPLFYTHHANVDRFWEFWRASYKGDDPAWLRHSFGFHDEHGDPVSISVADLLDLDALGYRYHPLPARDLLYGSQTVTRTQHDTGSKGVTFSAKDFEELLRGGQAAESAAHLPNQTLPCRIFGAAHGARNGQGYLVGIQRIKGRAHASAARIIGGFGQFMGPKMRDMEVVATCSLSLADMQFIADANYRVRLVWGVPDRSGTAIAGQERPFWPVAKVELLFIDAAALLPH